MPPRLLAFDFDVLFLFFTEENERQPTVSKVFAAESGTVARDQDSSVENRFDGPKR